jgi:ubiquinone/menaquinone biosynthesis C-methylase UbiE
MTSSFNVHKASGYEQLMGRWSRILAPQLIEFSGVKAGERILDVGCGTGSLTFALPKAANVSEVVGIDYSPVFVEEAVRRNSDSRISIRQADACALPFPDGRFDRALSLLVLHFVPETSKAVAEMRRVVRSGGVVAAAVWDHLGGMPAMRMVLDTLAPLDDAAARLRSHYCFQPMMRPGEMRQTFGAQGLMDVEETSMLIRMDYARKAKAGEAVRAAYEAGQPDGRRSFVAVAWACRGRVP